MSEKKEALSSEEVENITLDILSKNLSLSDNGLEYDVEDFYRVLLYSASENTSIEQACLRLKGAPHPNTVRYRLSKLDIDTLEEEINEGIRYILPKGLSKGKLKIAIDFSLIPYYGKREEDNSFLLRSEAKASTTCFFGYVSAYVCTRNKRYTLALYALRKEEKVVEVLKRVLERLKELGIKVKCLYLDRGFYQVKVIKYLLEEGLPFVMPAVKKGRGNGGIKKLFKGRKSYRTTYLVSNQEDKVEVKVIVLCSYKGKYSEEKGIEYQVYCVNHYERDLRRVAGDYQDRFGIESSYRMMNEARGRTASSKEALRYLFVGIAFLLLNIWVFFKFSRVSRRRRGGRLVLSVLFPFALMLSFISQGVSSYFGLITSIFIPTL